MTKQKPPTEAQAIEIHDPFAIRTIEQFFALFSNGTFARQILTGSHKLRQDLLDHLDEHGSKGATGEMQIKVKYVVSQSRDIQLAAELAFKPPKQPPSTANAYVGENGELTLYSPMMRKMHEPVRDVTTDYDPETGEVRDPSGPSDIRDI